MDQFDAFFARSKQQQQYAAPEVNIEVPSDSDSSRRPSKYTLSNASSVQDIYAEMAVAASQAEKGANTRPRSQFQPANQPVRRVSQQQSGKNEIEFPANLSSQDTRPLSSLNLWKLTPFKYVVLEE